MIKKYFSCRILFEEASESKGDSKYSLTQTSQKVSIFLLGGCPDKQEEQE